MHYSVWSHYQILQGKLKQNSNMNRRKRFIKAPIKTECNPCLHSLRARIEEELRCFYLGWLHLPLKLPPPDKNHCGNYWWLIFNRFCLFLVVVILFPPDNVTIVQHTGDMRNINLSSSSLRTTQPRAKKKSSSTRERALGHLESLM